MEKVIWQCAEHMGCLRERSSQVSNTRVVYGGFTPAAAKSEQHSEVKSSYTSLTAGSSTDIFLP